LTVGDIQLEMYNGHFATVKTGEGVAHAPIANANLAFQFISKVLRHHHHGLNGSIFFLWAILLHSLPYTYGHCAIVPHCLPLPLYGSLSANSASTSPWQAFGLHQQPSVFPLSSERICLINEVLARKDPNPVLANHILPKTICSNFEWTPQFDGLPI
jgi:hypothetical protein